METKNYFSTDAAGNIIPSATCYLYLPGTTTLATGITNINGAPIANPFTAAPTGLVQFKAPDGEYDLRVVGGGREFSIRIQCFDGVAFTAGLPSLLAAANISYSSSGDGAITQTVESALRARSVSIMDFGAAGIGGDDTAAVKAAMAYALASGRPLYIPGGSYGLTEQLTAANKSLTIIGDGIGISKLFIDHAAKGLAYSSTDRTQNLSISGIEIISSNNAAVSGLDITFPTTTSVDQSQLSLTDVTVRVSGSGTWTYSCVRLDGVKNPFVKNVVVRGAIASTLYGISLEGQTIDADLDTVRAYLVNTGIYITGANEGTSIRGYTAVTVKRGVDVNPTNSGPWVEISNFHINSSEYGIRLYKRTQAKITCGLLYANNLLGSTLYTGISIEADTGGFAEYCDVTDVVINRQSFSNPTIGINYANARFCTTALCKFINIAQPWVEDAASNNNEKTNNMYPGVANPVTKAGAFGGEAFRIANDAFAQNRLAASGAITGQGPSLAAEGLDAIIGLGLYAKGAGATVTIGAIGAGNGLQVTMPASSVNRLRVQSSIAGQPAKLDAVGTDAQIWLSLQGKGSVGGLMIPVAADYANDAAAAAGGVPLRGVYHTAGALKVRLT